MFRFLDDIGLTAAGVLPHAARLRIEGHDSAGAGSAVTDDEEQEDKLEEGEEQEDIADDDQRVDDADDDGRPIGRSGKQKAAYDKLKGERDTLKTELDKAKQDAQEFRARLSAIEKTREIKDTPNDVEAKARALAKERARSIVSKLRTLDKNDPEFSEKLYEEVLVPIYTDQFTTTEEVSRRTSEEVTAKTRSREAQVQAALEEAKTELQEQGFPEDELDDYVRDLQDLSLVKQARDPDFFKTTPNDEQIPKLVTELKEKFGKRMRKQPEFQEQQRQHRKPMAGVLGEGSRGRRGGGSGEEKGEEGPGSMLTDLKSLRAMQRKRTSVMWRDQGR